MGGKYRHGLLEKSLKIGVSIANDSRESIRANRVANRPCATKATAHPASLAGPWAATREKLQSSIPFMDYHSRTTSAGNPPEGHRVGRDTFLHPNTNGLLILEW